MKPKRCALYMRVSTHDKGQTVDNQRRELLQLAARRGWDVGKQYEDNISGAKGREDRPGLDLMLKDASKGRFDVLLCWAIDRLGRSLQDLVMMLNDLHRARVDVVLHTQDIDTTQAAGKLMFHLIGAFAEFERSLIQSRVQAGMDRARECGTKSGRPIGRPALTPEQETAIMATSGLSLRAAARECGISPTAVFNVRQKALASGGATENGQDALVDKNAEFSDLVARRPPQPGAVQQQKSLSRHGRANHSGF